MDLSDFYTAYWPFRKGPGSKMLVGPVWAVEFVFYDFKKHLATTPNYEIDIGYT